MAQATYKRGPIIYVTLPNNTGANLNAGDAMGCGDDAGEATDFLPSATDAGANGNAGFFYDDATAGADDIECFIICD